MSTTEAVGVATMQNLGGSISEYAIRRKQHLELVKQLRAIGYAFQETGNFSIADVRITAQRSSRFGPPSDNRHWEPVGGQIELGGSYFGGKCTTRSPSYGRAGVCN